MNVSIENLKLELVAQIKARTQALGWTQKELANALGVSQSRVSNLVALHIEKFSIDALYKYCNTLSIWIEVVFTYPYADRVE